MRLLLAFILLPFSVFLISSCGKPADQKAYQEFVATMSMEKAKKFFDTYQQSGYRDKVVNDIIEWCNQEGTEDCYKLAMDVIPKNHPRYGELISYYETHFANKR